MIYNKSTKIIFAITLFLNAFNLFAGQSQTANEDKDIEHITVTGEDQISVLRYAMYRAEEEFFNSFNDLTTNKDFKITCKKEPRHAFTRIVERQCKSAFESDIAFEITQRAIRSGRGGITNSPLKNEIYQEQEKIRKKQIAEMEKLIQENPKLMAKLIELNQAKAKLEHARKVDKSK